MNQAQLDLLDDVPTKCPYFTLADVSNFLGPKDLEELAELNKSQYNSLIDLFGQIERMSDDQQTQFLLHVLKHADFKPDFEAAADALKIANGNHIMRRFKSILQKQGFDFDEKNNHVVGEGDVPEIQKSEQTTKNANDNTKRDNSSKAHRGVKRRQTRGKRVRDESSTASSTPVRKRAKTGYGKALKHVQDNSDKDDHDDDDDAAEGVEYEDSEDGTD